MTTPSRGQSAYEKFRADRSAARYPGWSDLTPGERDGWEASSGGPVPRRTRLRKTAPQPVLSAPIPMPAVPVPPAIAAPSAQEETVMSPVSAALAAIQHEAAAVERTVNANPLAVILAARHVGMTFTTAEAITIADFLAGLEAERAAQADSRARAAAAAAVAANGAVSPGTGPHPVLQ